MPTALRAERIGVTFSDLPPFAAWQHCAGRSGFELVFLSAPPHQRAEGDTAAVEAEGAWAVHYAIEVSDAWLTSSAYVTGRSPNGTHEVGLETDGRGRWRIDGRPAAYLDGCRDVDLEASCLTNALPVRRLGLEVGQTADVPAAYVRASDLSVERLEQSYTRLEDLDGAQRYHYRAPAFAFACELSYDRAGLVLAYPGIGRRVA
jgi:hypothetical protein